MHHFRERLKEEERRRDEEMMRSYDSWRNPQDNERKPVYRLARRGPATKLRTDTDPLGLRSGVVQVAPRTRHRPAPSSFGDQRPTLEELLRKKAEARNEERLFEKRQLEIADGTFHIGGHPSAPKPRRFRSLNNVTTPPDGDLQDIFPWTKPRESGPNEKNGNMAGLSFHEKMGWSTSDHAPKKSREELREYLDFLKDEMDDRQNRIRNESLQDANSNTSDMAEVMSQSLVGKPPISTALRRRTRHLL